MPHSLSNLLLNGNELNSTYSFDDTKFNSWYIRNYSLSYAREIKGVLTCLFKNYLQVYQLNITRDLLMHKVCRLNNNYMQTGVNNQITLNSNYVVQSAFSNNFNVKYSFDSTKSKVILIFKSIPFPACR